MAKIQIYGQSNTMISLAEQPEQERISESLIENIDVQIDLNPPDSLPNLPIRVIYNLS